MSAFELLVHDLSELYDERPSTLMTMREWWNLRLEGREPFALHPYEGIGIRLSDGIRQFVEENFGGIGPTAAGCDALTRRLEEGRVALLRTSTDNPGIYLLFSCEDPVRMTIVREGLEVGNAPYPFYPSEKSDPPEASQQLLTWAGAEAERLLAPSGNPAYDRARGLLLRLPRAALISEVASEAELAKQIKRELWG
jgi:hypothetical protein